MSIAVTCSGCSATFKVKDEYAGKRAKCPKCNGPIVVPSPFHGGDTFLMPPPKKTAPVTSAPKPAPAPVPVDDEAADEPPQAKRREEDEKKPTAKPTAKKRRDDDEPKKKKSALPLVLGILVGLVLVCGGGGAALWFLVIDPAINGAVLKQTGAIPTNPSGETPSTPK